VILFELETELRNLRMAFPRAEFKQEEFLVWFKKFKHWSLNRFQTTLDRLIESEDRFPSISKVMQAGRDYNEDQLSKIPKTNCDSCLSVGIIYATYEGYRFAFRCDDCRNWDGYFGERVPLWSAIYIGKGYQPDKFKQIIKIDKPSDEWLDAI
jgi:hypothetical protein